MGTIFLERLMTETSKDSAVNGDVANLPFEKALAELETIVSRLERGDVALEESIAIYERGEALKARCEGLLKQAEARIERITLTAEGRPSGAVPLDEAK
jgi:exodeoxyribonuclease VII small subunit